MFTQEQIAQMQADLAALQNENARLKAQSFTTESKLSVKVAEKSSGVSVYGLQRFPITLRATQWERLLADKGSILNFIETNRRNGALPSAEQEAINAKAAREAKKTETKV